MSIILTHWIRRKSKISLPQSNIIIQMAYKWTGTLSEILLCIWCMHAISFHKLCIKLESSTCRVLGGAESVVVVSAPVLAWGPPQPEVKLIREFQLLLALLVSVLHRLFGPWGTDREKTVMYVIQGGPLKKIEFD